MHHVASNAFVIYMVEQLRNFSSHHLRVRKATRLRGILHVSHPQCNFNLRDKKHNRRRKKERDWRFLRCSMEWKIDMTNTWRRIRPFVDDEQRSIHRNKKTSDMVVGIGIGYGVNSNHRAIPPKRLRVLIRQLHVFLDSRAASSSSLAFLVLTCVVMISPVNFSLEKWRTLPITWYNYL